MIWLMNVSNYACKFALLSWMCNVMKNWDENEVNAIETVLY